MFIDANLNHRCLFPLRLVVFYWTAQMYRVPNLCRLKNVMIIFIYNLCACKHSCLYLLLTLLWLCFERISIFELDIGMWGWKRNTINEIKIIIANDLHEVSTLLHVHTTHICKHASINGKFHLLNVQLEIEAVSCRIFRKKCSVWLSNKWWFSIIKITCSYWALITQLNLGITSNWSSHLFHFLCGDLKAINFISH
jgi:hypothetical protein